METKSSVSRAIVGIYLGKIRALRSHEWSDQFFFQIGRAIGETAVKSVKGAVVLELPGCRWGPRLEGARYRIHESEKPAPQGTSGKEQGLELGSLRIGVIWVLLGTDSSREANPTVNLTQSRYHSKPLPQTLGAFRSFDKQAVSKLRRRRRVGREH